DLAEGPPFVIIPSEQVMKCPPPAQARRFDYRFAQWKEHTFAVWRTSLCDHVRIRADRGHELSRQTGLADSGFAQDGHSHDRARPDRPPKRGTNPRELVLADSRSEEHTSELQSRVDLVCRLLLEKKKT